MHNAYMSTKTISLKSEAYDKLKAAKKYSTESFSQVVLRASWPEETITGGALLRIILEQGAQFNERELSRIEQLKKRQKPPADKWKRR